MSYVIEDNIPLPPTKKGGNYCGPQTEVTKVVESLEPGQSVLLLEHHDFRTAGAYVGRHRVKRYAIRKIAGQGWRVWRTE